VVRVPGKFCLVPEALKEVAPLLGLVAGLVSAAGGSDEGLFEVWVQSVLEFLSRVSTTSEELKWWESETESAVVEEELACCIHLHWVAFMHRLLEELEEAEEKEGGVRDVREEREDACS
jgi:hypothetical protein